MGPRTMWQTIKSLVLALLRSQAETVNVERELLRILLGDSRKFKYNLYLFLVVSMKLNDNH